MKCIKSCACISCCLLIFKPERKKRNKINLICTCKLKSFFDHYQMRMMDVLLRPNKKISVFPVTTLKILDRVGTHFLFFFFLILGNFFYTF